MKELHQYLHLILDENINNPVVKIAVLVLTASFSILLSLTLPFLMRRTIRRIFRVSKETIRILNQPVQALFVTVIINIALPVIHFTGPLGVILKKIFYIALIIVFTFFLIRILSFLRMVIFEKHKASRQDTLNQRKVQTQIAYIERVILLFIFIVSSSLILMSFSQIRELGKSLLASAGIAGLIIGLAAQKTIANTLAGLQIAFTQPIRIHDVVFVENEIGRIEELTLTYVVVNVWDKRRIILPISYFIDKPFQNWTRTTSDLVGTINFQTEFSVTVEEIRNEVSRILKSSPLWDGKINKTEVTDLTDKNIHLRILVSASNVDDLWDLKCFVREKLSGFVYNKTHGPGKIQSSPTEN
jgi:small-conductance mechanosensitive channel